jgi:disulfide bond formation protein DsbB
MHATTPEKCTLRAKLVYFSLLLSVTVVAGILTAAMALQYGDGELPCPLCLLQRLALFGVCFGSLLSFRYGLSFRNIGISMVFSIVLLIISIRQTLLDIYPRPGHEYVGSAVFGLHLPVWSCLIALALLTSQAIQIVVLGDDPPALYSDYSTYPPFRTMAHIVTVYVIFLCSVNFFSVVLQCGLGECHTSGYRLLQ